MPSRHEKAFEYIRQADAMLKIAEEMRSKDPKAAHDLCEMAVEITEKAEALMSSEEIRTLRQAN